MKICLKPNFDCRVNAISKKQPQIFDKNRPFTEDLMLFLRFRKLFEDTYPVMPSTNFLFLEKLTSYKLFCTPWRKQAAMDPVPKA